MDPLTLQVAARFAAEVIQFRPRTSGPKLEIGGKHYGLSTDSGPLAGDLAEPPVQGEGGARLISPPEHSNKWRYLWAYDVDNQVLGMWRVSDGDEKVYDSAKHAGAQIVRLEKKGQLNRVSGPEFRAIEAWMHRKTQETIEDLKRVVEENKSSNEKELDQLVHEYFQKHVSHRIERAISDIERGATPIGFKPYDPAGKHVSVERQAAVYVIGQILKHEMSEAHVETYLRQRGFDLESIHNQSVEWAIGDVRDEAFEAYLPPR